MLMDWLVDLIDWGVDVKRRYVCIFRHSPRWDPIFWVEDGKHRVAYWCKRCKRFT